MTDRELLEAAAKAAGIEHVTPMMIEWGQWNPLTDDGDALRLAVRLNMDIRFYPGLNDPWVETAADGGDADELLNPDSCAAARRAIVRAAAIIGKGMK